MKITKWIIIPSPFRLKIQLAIFIFKTTVMIKSSFFFSNYIGCFLPGDPSYTDIQINLSHCIHYFAFCTHSGIKHCDIQLVFFENTLSNKTSIIYNSFTFHSYPIKNSMWAIGLIAAAVLFFKLHKVAILTVLLKKGNPITYINFK